jgi:predicted transcriptional regulator
VDICLNGHYKDWRTLSMDADVKRDLVRKNILLQINNGVTRYTDIKDKVTIKCQNFASSNTIKKQFYRYLIPQGYIQRTNPGRYKLTKKGEKLLSVLITKSN